MVTSESYRAFARECLREAESTEDDVKARELFELCRLYMRSALQLERGMPPEKKAA
jgi:hypothetical protein